MELFDCEMSIDICSETCKDLSPAYISPVNHKPALIRRIIKAYSVLYTRSSPKISHYLPLTFQRHQHNLYVREELRQSIWTG